MTEMLCHARARENVSLFLDVFVGYFLHSYSLVISQPQPQSNDSESQSGQQRDS